MSVPASGSRPLHCSQCNRSYTRAEHLQRHLLTHGSERPFECHFCLQMFGRRDVLQRHFRTCKTRLEAKLDIPVLSQAVKGKKRASCDRCRRVKRACTATYPCASCVERNETCTFTEINAQKDAKPLESTSKNYGVPALNEAPGPEPQLDQWFNMPPTDSGQFRDLNYVPFAADGSFLDPYHDMNGKQTQQLPPDQMWHEVDFSQYSSSGDNNSASSSGLDKEITALACHPSTAATPLPFLSTFTRYNGFVSSFECGSGDERRELVDYVAKRRMILISDRPIVPQPPLSFIYEGQLPGPNGMFPNGFYPLTSLHPPTALSSTAEMNSQPLTEPASPLTEAIVGMIRDVTENKSRRSKVTLTWTAMIEATCYKFFSDTNIEKYLELYWACWATNAPIIHRPSFSTTKASPLLVASMMLIGACYSPDVTEKTEASLWFNSVEELVFDEEILHDESIVVPTGPIEDPTAIRGRLEAVQAAFCVCVLQEWEGSTTSKQRIRRHSYSALLAAARDFGMANLTRSRLRVNNVSEFSWDEFVLVEEMIRTGTFIFLLDCEFVIFHNSPPRLVVQEMQMALACPADCFQAGTAKECFLLLNSWTSSRPYQASLTVHKAVEFLCRGREEELVMRDAMSLSILNLFTIVTAMHSVMFHLRSSFASHSELSPIQTGLTRWIKLWNQGTHLEELRLRSFPACCEMWRRVGFYRHADEYWLLAKLILERWRSKTNAQSSGSVNILLDGDKTSHDTSYDESDMKNIHKLISDFQQMNFTGS